MVGLDSSRMIFITSFMKIRQIIKVVISRQRRMVQVPCKVTKVRYKWSYIVLVGSLFIVPSPKPENRIMPCKFL
jgi:hypothetical protein